MYFRNRDIIKTKTINEDKFLKNISQQSVVNNKDGLVCVVKPCSSKYV